MKMPEISLPPQNSLKNDADDDLPFQVINVDNLPMTVLGERIFKPFGSENQKRKPNGIVYPTRRIDLSNQQITQQKHLTKSNGHLNVPHKNASKSNCRKLSASHGNLKDLSKNKNQDEFTRNLDAKLKRLQTDRRRNDSKKPFITTVKKGEFISPDTSPPPNKTSKIEEDDSHKNNFPVKKQLYTFTSKPVVLSRSPPQNVHRARCEAAAIAAGVPYTKETFETDINGQKQRKKRDTRTSSPEKQTNKEVEDIQKNDLEEIPAKKTREEIAERRALARKKARMQTKKKNEAGSYRPTKNVRFVSAEIQTENYLQAILIKPPNVDSTVQTESEIIEGSKTLKVSNEETQIVPGDLFDFEEEVQPVLEVLVGKTIETALIEILEEEELATLKEQQRRFLEMRVEEERITGELLEKHFIERMHRNKTGGVSILLENYLSHLIPPVIEELRAEGVILEDRASENGSFLLWLMEEVTIELGDILSTGDVLNGIVRDIMNRKKELCKAMDSSKDLDENKPKSEFEK